jgi:4-hydroxy-3-polyprenylbenzoate decarboxylase
MKQPGGGKALLVEKPTINGQASSFPLAINTLGSSRRMALALGVSSVDEAAAELGALIQAKPPAGFREALKLLGAALDLRHAKPTLVKDGPCKEIKHLFPTVESVAGEPPAASIQPPLPRDVPWPADEPSGQGHKPDSPGCSSPLEGAAPAPTPGPAPPVRTLFWPTLLDLPILKCWPLDAGRFITLPCVVTQDPDTGARNVGMYRMQVFDERTTGMHWQLQKVGARHGRRYYETGTRMPVSVFLGGDPALTFCATAPLPDGLDEFLLAGYLRKQSVALVQCETNDLQVPADADVVIEGYVAPREPLRLERPFGDHTGFYTLPDLYPAFHLTAITHRKDAVYPATIVGRPPMEDFYLGSASARLFLPILKMNFPELVDLALPPEGVFHNLACVSIKKSYPMQAYKVMHGLWGLGQMMFTKYLVVVDDDVDVHHTGEVLFRLCANTDPQRDIIFTKGPADVLDHATNQVGVGTKLGLDATRKLPGEGFPRPWPPLITMEAAVKQRVDEWLKLAR